ncbi:S8 family peptidase [Olleya sp. HaHaR_3_96]|uniref:S8 family peptidase n=1 Tax=Olleya sp. HaHaR_3_96 TaxID=2745560 RepID=UPI001C4ECFB9|nr:S8 family peptidase [Olleya sp. HaHaR_3_96]QXP58906.1 S8 family peptidase [Olleya sp. HaHaR_3_96]
MSNKHVYLNNERNHKNGFNRKRGMKPKVSEEKIEEPTIKEFQVVKLRENYIAFNKTYDKRYENRIIEFPNYIDLIEIRFFMIFNKDLKNIFFQKYGLLPVSYSDFNRTVVFEVNEKVLFEKFKIDIEYIISFEEDVPYSGEDHNLIASIYNFRFIDKRAITGSEDNIILSTIQSVSIETANLQKGKLILYLEDNNLQFSTNENEDLFYLERVNKDVITIIEQNFDIVQSITSSRAFNVRPGMFGTLRTEHGFKVDVPSNLPTVGIIDTGINTIEPFEGLIVDGGINITRESDIDVSGHGTLVSGLAIFGQDLPSSVKGSYVAKCKVLPIKVLHRNNDGIDFPMLLQAIRKANKDKGIRLFNMSLVFSPKKYNEAFSDFAYELDILSHELGVLIFISVGNFDPLSLRELLTVDSHSDHDYPNFYYKLNSTSPVHTCENTNISTPSESLNNLSIGALAGNLEEDDNSDITPNNIYPAYYTRKFHFDYEQKVNTQPFNRNQKNKNLNKPDLVFDGGDYLRDKSGIEVLARPNDNFFRRTAGTSLSTPLITSIAAEIQGVYPDLSVQSIKALLINSASYYKSKELPLFEKNETLLKKLVGHGIPDREQALLSDNNSITMVIEDQIKPFEIISLPIFLPRYLIETGNKLIFKISISYSSYPDRGNHLGYLPLHMSFNLMQNISIDDISAKKSTETVAKKGFSWSEDHFGKENILFSNVQSQQYKLQPKDIISLNGEVAVAIRCLTKDNVDENLLQYLDDNEHAFSLIINIKEELNNVTGNNLYNEMLEINNLNVISDVETGLDLDLGI